MRPVPLCGQATRAEAYEFMRADGGCATLAAGSAGAACAIAASTPGLRSVPAGEATLTAVAGRSQTRAGATTSANSPRQ